MHVEDAAIASPTTVTPHLRALLGDVRTWLAAGVLVVALLLTFVPGMRNAITEPCVDAPAAPDNVFTAGRWEPLTLWMCARVGVDGLHLTTLALHALSTVLLYVLTVWLVMFALRRVRPTIGIHAAALVGALLFALHPLRVEPIVWAARSGVLLATAATLAAVLLYVRGAAPGGWGWRVASLVVFALALLAGPWAIGLPLALVLLDAYPLRRRMCGACIWLEKIPFVALATAAGVVNTRAALAGTPDTFAWYGRTCYALVFPFWQHVWPAALAPAYDLPVMRTALLLAFYGSLAAVVVLIILAVLVARRSSGLAVVIGGYLALALPTVLALLPMGNERADAASTLPGAVLAIGVAGGIAMLLSARSWSVRAFGIPLTLVGLAAAGLLALQTRQQCTYWVSPVLIWDHAGACQAGTNARYPRARAHQLLGDVGVAAQLYKSILQTGNAQPEVYQHLVEALLETGTPDEAVEQARAGVHRFPSRPELHAAVGVALAAQGKLTAAATALEAVAREAPRYAREMGHVCMLQGYWASAAQAFARARTALPHDADLAYDEGHALQLAGDIAGARRAYEAALKLQPGHPLATRALAELPAR